MTEQIAHPDIEVQPGSAVAQAATTAIDLAKVDLTDIALAKFGKWRDKAAESRKTLTGVQHDLSTQAKIDDAKSLRQRLINAPLAEARKVSKAVKSKLNTVSAEVGEELKSIETEYESIAQLITPQIEAREAEIAEEKRIAEEKETKRKADIQARIDVITACATRAREPEMTSARILKGIELVEAITIDDSFAEFRSAAAEAKTYTLGAMIALAASAKAREDEAARVEAQRIENERVAEEQRQRAEALAAQQAALEQAAAELRAQQEAQKAEAERLEAAKALAAAPAPEAAPIVEPSPVQPEIQQAGQEVTIQDQAPAANAETVQPAAAELTRADCLNLGEINAALGKCDVTAAQLKALGLEPVGTERRSTLFRRSDFEVICDALADHLTKIRGIYRKAA